MVGSLGLGNGKLREFKVLFWEIMLLAAKAIFIYSLVHRMTVHTTESCSCCSAYLCSRKQVQLCGTKTMKERKKEKDILVLIQPQPLGWVAVIKPNNFGWPNSLGLKPNHLP